MPPRRGRKRAAPGAAPAAAPLLYPVKWKLPEQAGDAFVGERVAISHRAEWHCGKVDSFTDIGEDGPDGIYHEPYWSVKWDERPGEAWDEADQEQLFLPGWQLADVRHNFELMMTARTDAARDQEASMSSSPRASNKSSMHTWQLTDLACEID